MTERCSKCGYRMVSTGGFPWTFPHLRRFDGVTVQGQANKICDEAAEAKCETYKEDGTTDDFIIEVMDVMQACETALRISGRTDAELLELLRRHNEKDLKRGYNKPEGDD